MPSEDVPFITLQKKHKEAQGKDKNDLSKEITLAMKVSQVVYFIFTYQMVSFYTMNKIKKTVHQLHCDAYKLCRYNLIHIICYNIIYYSHESS